MSPFCSSRTWDYPNIDDVSEEDVVVMQIDGEDVEVSVVELTGELVTMHRSRT